MQKLVPQNKDKEMAYHLLSKKKPENSGNLWQVKADLDSKTLKKI